MNRLILQDKIVDLLSVFSTKLTILSANNEYSWNSLAENIFIPLLNLTLEGKFVNENLEEFKNVAAIDLVDRSKRITIQVTSSGTFSKVKKTLEKFIDDSLENEFDKIYLFVLKDKLDFNISKSQEEQINDIIQDRVQFSANKNILDFRKIYTLTNKIDIDDLSLLCDKLQKELGDLSSELVKNSPAVAVLFDDKETELAYDIIKGLLERDLRIRHFSAKLEKLLDQNGLNTKYCQRLYDISKESSATLILSTKEYVSKIESGTLSEFEIQTLKNPHLKHILVKFDENASFRNFDWISPLIMRGLKSDLNTVINFASNELHKVNKVIEIQDYSDFETIIKLYDNKSSYGKTISHKDSSKKIAYQLVPATNELLGVTTNYLFLPKGSTIAPSANLFYKENSDLKNKRETIVLVIPKERGQIRLEDRLKNAKKLFKPRKAFYLDEFVSQFCADGIGSLEKNVKFSSTNNFIQPELKAIEGGLSDFDQIENWIRSEFDPILVITGGGGIGKTTLAREIADRYNQLNSNSNIVFIEASDPQVVNNLTRLSEAGKIDLYDFYSSIDSESKISRELFRVTIDNGNLLLIIDGLDEVFSRIPDFDVEYFIRSVSSDFVKQIGVGKVLLTCRTYFWKEQISKENSINHFEIEAFSIDHAQRFFDKKFGDVKKVKKSLSLLKEMNVNNDGEERYLPFVVDIVGEIIDSGRELLNDAEDVGLRLLDTRKQNDFIVFRLLKREQIKIDIDVHSQIEFLIHLAVHKRGTLKKSEVEDLKKYGLAFTLDEKRLESLKSHPLINVSNYNISFKYDFYELFFKTIYISEFISINSNEPISNSIIDILLSEGKFGSSLFYEVSKRCEEKWGEDNVLKISDLIGSIERIVIDKENKVVIKHQIKSSLFALALMINQSKCNNQTATNTSLLVSMFGANNIISDLSLVNFGILDGNIKFNFSGLKFKNCYFDSYDSFWECKFDVNTRFEDCTFYNLPNYSRSNSRGISKDNFINAKNDIAFEDYFMEQDQGSASKRKKVSYSLAKYLRLFYANGILHDKDNKSTIHTKYHPKDKRNLPIQVIENVLGRSKILSIVFDKVRGETVASIEISCREDIFKFLQEGVETNKMKKIINEMVEEINIK